MQEFDTVVVGAGPAGLGAAIELSRSGSSSWIVLEASRRAGGLSSTVTDELGFTWSFGSRIYFTSDENAAKVFNGYGVKWKTIPRKSYVNYHGTIVPYPLQSNLDKLPEPDRSKCICATPKSPTGDAQNLRDLLLDRFGNETCKRFLFPYNLKMWGVPLETLDVSIATRRIPSHASSSNTSWGPNSEFLHPETGGAGALWENISLKFSNRILYGNRVIGLDIDSRTVTTGAGLTIRYKRLINSAPLPDTMKMVGRGNSVHSVTTDSIGIGLTGRPPPDLENVCWMYFPFDDVPFHRLSVQTNYSNSLAPSGCWSIIVESSTRISANEVVLSLASLGLIEAQNVVSTNHMSMSGYPTPTLDVEPWKSESIKLLLDAGVVQCGRFGLWTYERGNQDDALVQGMLAARRK